MAISQDYLSMALSMVIGNKSGTNQSVLLPDDFRKIQDTLDQNLPVDTYSTYTGSIAGNAVHAFYNYDFDTAGGGVITGNDSMFIVFFTHPVEVTMVSGSALSPADAYFQTSFVAFARNYVGSAKFGDEQNDASQNTILNVRNTLESPTYIRVGSTPPGPVNFLAVHVKLLS